VENLSTVDNIVVQMILRVYREIVPLNKRIQIHDSEIDNVYIADESVPLTTL